MTDLSGRPSPQLTSVIAAAAAVVTAGVLAVGAWRVESVFAGVILIVQIVFVAAWSVTARPASQAPVAAIGVGTALAATTAALSSSEATAAPFTAVLAGAFGAALLIELVRGSQRHHPTEEMGGVMIVALTVVALASALPLQRRPSGLDLLLVLFAAAGGSVAMARLMEAAFPGPAVARPARRGLVGVGLGVATGTALAAWVAAVVPAVSLPKGILLGMAVAVAAVTVDLASSLAGTSARLAGAPTTRSPLRHLVGPVLGVAVAAPVGFYLGSALLA